jgi:hypothetical protein
VNPARAGIRALTFGIFGTGDDWHTSITHEGKLLGAVSCRGPTSTACTG